MSEFEMEHLVPVPETTVSGMPYVPGDIAWTLVCSALVWLMVPGVGFFYSGLARSKSALSLISLCCWSIAVVSIQVIKKICSFTKNLQFY
jgi:Amt family ammonium transporter